MADNIQQPFSAEDDNEICALSPDDDVPSELDMLDAPDPTADDDDEENKITITEEPDDAEHGEPMLLQTKKVYNWKCDLNNKSLKPFHVVADSWGGGGANKNREFVKDGNRHVLKVKYPKGTTTPTSKFNPKGKRGGTGFYAEPLPLNILAKAKQVSLEYSVYFPPKFNFVRGGKLPGLYGGSGNARGCSGGSSASDCYSARVMWRKNGDGELYLYTPKAAKQHGDYKKIPPSTHCNPGYGDSIARGSFKFAAGGWTRVRITVVLNSPGKQNGVIRLHANGKEVVKFDKIVWRTNDRVVTKGIMFQTFFGGSTADCAPPSDTHTMFKDFCMTANL